LKALKINSNIIKYISNNLKNNENIFEESLKQDPLSIKYASEDLK
jgi:hypothetical protein